MSVETLMFVLAGFAAGAVVAGLMVFAFYRHKDREIEMLEGRLEETADKLAEKEKALESARLAEATLQSRMEEQQHHHREKLQLLEQTRERLNEEFKQLAGEIFEAKHRTFKQESREQLDNMLKPLGERIREFEKRVEKTYSDESRERFSLIKEVKNLQDLNAKISEDAVNLTNALKGHSKTQGTWGEVILERVLERSGLEKDREYEIQVNMKTGEGRRLQPDVVVHLPEEKDIIIDAKVSLTAYERFCSTEDEGERQASLKAHIQSVRTHIKRLSEKDYQNLEAVRTLDFVLLFIPVEAAFSLAVQEDSELFSDSFDLNIVIVSPSTLLATLRTIQNIWRYEQQNRNAQEIAGRAGALYDKFVNFVSDLEDIGARLASAQTAWESAHNKLTSGRGNLVRRAEDMKELGARVSKSLPKNLVEMPPRDTARIRETR